MDSTCSSFHSLVRHNFLKEKFAKGNRKTNGVHGKGLACFVISNLGLLISWSGLELSSRKPKARPKQDVRVLGSANKR